MKKKKQFHRTMGLKPMRLDAPYARTKRYVAPLHVDRKSGDPDEQYRRCGICKVKGIDRYATYIARLPGRDNWVNLCPEHFRSYGCKLGPHDGQKIIVDPRYAEHFETPEEAEKKAAALLIKRREEEKKAKERQERREKEQQ